MRITTWGNPADAALTNAIQRCGWHVQAAASPNEVLWSEPDVVLFTAKKLSTADGAIIRSITAAGVACILITSLEAESAAMLGPLYVDHVIWIHEGTDGILRAIKTFASRDPLGVLADVVQAADRFCPVMQHLLQLALRQEPPFRSVGAWFRCAGVSRAHGAAVWASSLDARALPPRRFVDCVLLIRLLQRRRHGTSMVRIGDVLGRDPRTLRRLSRREIQKSYSAATSSDCYGVLRHLRQALAAG